MKLPGASHCPNCGGLTRRLPQQDAEIASLKAKPNWPRLLPGSRKLEQQLAAAPKDSATSSKPPSSDIVKPPKPKLPGGQRRKHGGQTGHPRHARPLFPPKQVDHTWLHE